MSGPRVIAKALDAELLDIVKQLIALEGHLSDDAVRTLDIDYQKHKDGVRAMRKVLMRKLLHASDQLPSLEVRRRLASSDCIIKHLCLSFVILTEICDLLSRADRDKEVVEVFGYAKNLNKMLYDYIGNARKILESEDDQNIRQPA